MKVMQSFLVLFYILDQCYGQCKESDLGCFLGAICPELWGDGMPMDMAIYDDWKNTTDTDTLNNQNITEAVFRFIEYYEKQFHFHFKETKKALIDFANDEVIAKALEQTEIMYQKFAYTN